MSDTFIDERANGESTAAELRSTLAVRERCGQLLSRARHGESAWLQVDEAGLDEVSGRVVDAVRGLRSRAPLHSHWRHLEAGGIDRRRQLDSLLAGMAPALRVQALLDLTVTSVLLAAAPAGDWAYMESASGRRLSGPDGLAVAGFHAFCAGMFSSDRRRPFQVDAAGLRGLPTDHLGQVLQVTPSNRLPALEERAVLLRRLGEVMSEQPQVFGDDARPGGLYVLLVSGPEAPPSTAELGAHDLLSQILISLSGLTAHDNAVGGVPLGDCWRHAAVQAEGPSAGWVPLHGLAQWLAYSLVEPLMWCGVSVRGLDAFTALADDANVGLLLDTGVLRPRDAAHLEREWLASDELIVEWRACTLSLMDEVVARVRGELHADAHRLPPSVILQGGCGPVAHELAQRRAGRPALRVAGGTAIL